MRYLVLLGLSLAGFSAWAKAEIAVQPENISAAPSLANAANPAVSDKLLGLPPVPIPLDNPQTPAKIALGDKLFHDKRFSIDGSVSCANCHNDQLAFTDGLPVSVGHSGLTGTRSAPTVLNAAF